MVRLLLHHSEESIWILEWPKVCARIIKSYHVITKPARLFSRVRTCYSQLYILPDQSVKESEEYGQAYHSGFYNRKRIINSNISKVVLYSDNHIEMQLLSYQYNMSSSFSSLCSLKRLHLYQRFPRWQNVQTLIRYPKPIEIIIPSYSTLTVVKHWIKLLKCYFSQHQK